MGGGGGGGGGVGGLALLAKILKAKLKEGGSNLNFTKP